MASSLRKLGRLEALDIASQVGPGDPGRQKLVGLALGFAELKPDREPVGTVGIVPEILLEVLDRARRHCRPSGWLGPSRTGSGRAAPGFRRARAPGPSARKRRWDRDERGDRRAPAISAQRSGKHRRAGLSAAPASKSDRLVASQLFGGRRVAGGQLDARQLETEFGRPAAGRVALDPLRRFPGLRRAGPRAARRLPGDKQNSCVIAILCLFGERDKCFSRV